MRDSYCSRYPGLLRRNLLRMGLSPAVLGNQSGFVIEDFWPLISTGRSFHDSVALEGHAPPEVVALWKTLIGKLD